MSRFVIVALLVAVAIAACNAQSEKRPELTEEECIKLPLKVWSNLSQCGRRLCSESDPAPCLMMFSPGCICEAGYVALDNNGTCVRREDCPEQ